MSCQKTHIYTVLVLSAPVTGPAVNTYELRNRAVNASRFEDLYFRGREILDQVQDERLVVFINSVHAGVGQYLFAGLGRDPGSNPG